MAAVTSASPITLVNASAGSGKTRSLIAKIRYILDHGAPPSSILAVTFTNKAAKEMKSRLSQFCPNVQDMQVSTMHSMCVRIMRKFIHHTPLKSPFSIYDDGDQTAVMKTLIKARQLKLDPGEVLSAIGVAKSKGHKGLEGIIGELYKAYQEILIANNSCDFDDLLIYAAHCMAQADCKAFYSDRWRHILVDEFQDTSTIQYKILQEMYDPSLTKTLFCVGDYNQAIYGWRGAQPQNMMDFIEKYSPTVCNLTYNYRSCSSVIAHANKFLQYGEQMVPKTPIDGKVSFSKFLSHEDEAQKIAAAIEQMGGYEETAILYRVNARSLMFERALASKRIPYKVVGDLPFYRRRVVKDMLAYCKAAANPADMESLVRIVNVPKRGFGETKQERLLREGRPYIEYMAQELPQIEELLTTLQDIKNMPPAEAIEHVLDSTGYRKTLEKESDGAMIEAILNVAEAFPTTEELILASTFLEEDSGKGVKLMTAHASKGLEFDRVFVVGVEEGVWPHKMAENAKEEERLYYVACTRARKYLNVSHSISRVMRGDTLEVQPSYLFTNSLRNHS